MLWFLFVIAMLVPAVWWWVQRSMLNRRAAWGVSVAMVALGLGLMFCLRGVCPELALSGFILAGFAFFGMVLMLCSEGSNMPECRRRRIEAGLPARPVDSATQSCSLSTEQMAASFMRLMMDISSGKDGTLEGDYEDDKRYWSGRLHPLARDGWMLQLWIGAADYLRDRELAAICATHDLPIEAVRMGTRADTLCFCRAGQLHIFPAAAKEDVTSFLSLFAPAPGSAHASSAHIISPSLQAPQDT